MTKREREVLEALVEAAHYTEDALCYDDVLTVGGRPAELAARKTRDALAKAEALEREGGNNESYE